MTSQAQRAKLLRDLYATVRLVVFERDRGRCRRCGRAGEQVHHRLPRRMGGARLDISAGIANLVTLCRRDHELVESARLVSYWDGWIVRSGKDPAAVPVHTRQGWLLFDDEGGETPCDPPSLT